MFRFIRRNMYDSALWRHNLKICKQFFCRLRALMRLHAEFARGTVWYISVCVCVCVCVCVYGRLWVCVCLSRFKCVFGSEWVCLWRSVSVCLCVCESLWECVSVCVCDSLCLCVCEWVGVGCGCGNEFLFVNLCLWLRGCEILNFGMRKTMKNTIPNFDKTLINYTQWRILLTIVRWDDGKLKWENRNDKMKCFSFSHGFQ